MILSKDLIVFCRIKAKCYWPAQIKQIKRGGGYDVHFINRDDLETQNRNESDMILFDEGFEKFKGSKQQGIEEAIEKAKQLIEEQSSSKKAQKKSQAQSINQGSQIKASSGKSIDGIFINFNQKQKAPNSHLTKRRNAQIASNNSIESQSSLEESSQIHEVQPTKKVQISTQNKGKFITKMAPIAQNNQPIRSNSKSGVSETSQADKLADVKQVKKMPQTTPITNNRIQQKKIEKNDEKLELKNVKAQITNEGDGKRTPTRSQLRLAPQKDQKLNNTLSNDTEKPPTTMKSKKQLVQETGKQSKAASKLAIKSATQAKGEKKETRQSGKEAMKQTETESEPNKPEKKNKKSNGDQSHQEESKQKKREVSTSSQTAQAGNKKIQKKENLKIAPTSSSTATSQTTTQSKKSAKTENKNSKQNLKDKNNLKSTVKNEEVSPRKKNANKRGGARKSASKKKGKNESMMETEEREQFEQNNLFKGGYYQNNSYYGNGNNEQDKQNDGMNLDNSLLSQIDILQTITQHIQESPEFGQKILGESVLSNNNNQNFNDEISQGVLQNIQNNQILSSLLNTTSSQCNNTNNSNSNNTFQGLNVNSPFTNNIFQTNENNKENIFSLNNSPFGNNERKYFDEQDELNLAQHPDENNKQALSLNQQQQILLNALKVGGVTQSQYDFYSQKLLNNNQNSFHLFENNQQNKQGLSSTNNTMNQNIKFNNIFASSSQNNIISDNSNSISVLGNITNSIQNFSNQQNNSNKNVSLGGLSQQIHPQINSNMQDLNSLCSNGLNNQGMSSSIANQSSILSFGVPKQEYSHAAQLNSLQPSSQINSQIFGLNSQGDFLTQNDIITLSAGHQLQQNTNLFASGIQTSFANQGNNLQNQNNHSVLIPSPKFITKQNSGQNNLQISNNSSFKLSPQSSKQQKCEVYNQMKNKILPMLEMKIKNKVYYENEKDMWLCEIVDCVRQLKTIPIEQIYHGEYAMILEQIYDALLTIQESTKRNFQYVLSMIQRTMTDLDKKIIKHLHDYSRVRGEKYNITREDEIQKKYHQAAEQAIKIEDKDDCIEICSSASFNSISISRSKNQNGFQNQIKIEPLQMKQISMSPPQKQNYRNKENESTAKKTSSRNSNDLSIQNGGFFNNNNNNSTNTTIGNISSTSMNQSINNDLFNQSISETIREINSQPEFFSKPNTILDLNSDQQLQKIVKEEVVA